MNFRFFLVLLYSFVVLTVGIPLMFIFRRKMHLLRKIWAYSTIWLLGVEIEVSGEIDTDADVLVLNHNSMLDAMLLEKLCGDEIVWVVKDTLSKIPIFGLILKLPQFILIDSSKRSSLKKFLVEAKKMQGKGRTLAIFPEGKHGQTDNFYQFHKGIKIVAEKLNLKVQPVVLVNTKNILNIEKRSAHAGKAKIFYLDTFSDLSDTKWFSEMEDHMKHLYCQEKKKSEKDALQ